MHARLDHMDANFWRLDTDTTHQAIASYCVFDRTPNIDNFRERMQHLVELFPKLRCKVYDDGVPQWIPDEQFSLDTHVRFICDRTIDSEEKLRAVISRCYSERLAMDKPLWRFTIVSNRPSGSGEAPCFAAGLFSVHHSLADGLGGIKLVDVLATPDEALVPELSLDSRMLKEANTARREAAGSPLMRNLGRLLRESFSSRAPSPLNGPNSPVRVLSTLEFPLAEFNRARRHFGGTLNDVLLTTLTGAIRHFHQLKNAPLHDVQVLMPVSLRMPTSWRDLGNQLTGIGVRLPVTVSDPRQQFHAISEFVKKKRRDGSLAAYALLSKCSSLLPQRIQRWLCETQARKTNFICTNMPLAKSAYYIGGAKVLSNYGMAALMRDHGASFAFITYADKVCVSIVSDPNIISDPAELLQSFKTSAAEMLAVNEHAAH